MEYYLKQRRNISCPHHTVWHALSHTQYTSTAQPPFFCAVRRGCFFVRLFLRPFKTKTGVFTPPAPGLPQERSRRAATTMISYHCFALNSWQRHQPAAAAAHTRQNLAMIIAGAMVLFVCPPPRTAAPIMMIATVMHYSLRPQ